MDNKIKFIYRFILKSAKFIEHTSTIVPGGSVLISHKYKNSIKKYERTLLNPQPSRAMSKELKKVYKVILGNNGFGIYNKCYPLVSNILASGIVEIIWDESSTGAPGSIPQYKYLKPQ